MAKTKEREHNKHEHVLSIFDQLLYDEKIGKNKSDALALYYAYACHIQKDSLSLLSVHNAAHLLNVSPNRVRKARKILTDLKLISSHSEQDEQGVVRHYVKLHGTGK